MKSWSEVESSPEFNAAPASVKAEVRGFYKAHVQAQPEFQDLPPDQKSKVLATIDGDADFAVKMAAALVVSAQKETLGREMVDPEKDNALVTAIKGAKLAEKYLDVPLRQRPRDPFQDEISGHLDKPLRSLIGFLEDATPEYAAVKFWNTKARLSLEDKIRDVLVLSSRFPPQPINLAAVVGGDKILIRDYPALERRLRANPQDPEALLKARLPQNAWNDLDLRVLRNVHAALAGLKNGMPFRFRPQVLPPLAASVVQTSYSLLLRALTPTDHPLSLAGVLPPAGNIPIDPDHIAEVILAAGALAPGMSEVADDFPSLFAVVSGVAQVPHSALGRYRSMQPLTALGMLQAVKTGSLSFIKMAQIDEMLFTEAARSLGARPEQMQILVRDGFTASAKPLLAALTARTEQFDRAQFKAKQDEIKKKIGAEAQRQLQNPPPTAPIPEEGVSPAVAQPQEEEGIHQAFEEGASALVVPEHLAFMDPDPEDPNAATEAPKSEVEALQAPAPAAASENRVLAYLTAHPLDIKSVKKAGLLKEFEKYPEVLHPSSKHEKSLDFAAANFAVANGLVSKDDALKRLAGKHT